MAICSRNVWLVPLYVCLAVSLGACADNTTTVSSSTAVTAASSPPVATTLTSTVPTTTGIPDVDPICAVECGKEGHGCEICSDETFSCPSKQLTAVCLHRITKNVTVINLDNNGLTSFVSFPGVYPSVVDLRISNNKLTKLAREDLAKFPSVKKLDLSHNNFVTLSGDVFEALPDLEELKLHGVSVYSLPDNIFSQNKQLHFIDLQGNKFQEFPAEIFKPIWNRMTSLVISENPIKEIKPENFLYLKNLKRLEMELLDIVKIDPHTFAALDKLKEINMEHNTKLAFIHKDAFGLSSARPGEMAIALEKASIRGCGLRSLDQETFNVKGMKSLGLSSNPWQCDCAIKWLMEKDLLNKAPGLLTELGKTECQDVAHRGIVISSVPLDHFVCVDPSHRELARFASGMGGATTVLVITFLLCVISIIFAVFMFRRRDRRAAHKHEVPTSVSQYRAIYNQGNVQTHDEGLVDKDKDPFEI